MEVHLTNPLDLIAVLAAVALLPFIAVMISSFSKVIVVFGLVRSALGLQTTPPNMVLNGLAIILSVYVMFPVISETYELADETNFADVTLSNLASKLDVIKQPIQGFLIKNSKPTMRSFFLMTAKRIWPPKYAQVVSENDLVILVPSFLVTELAAAFQIGFILYLPFVIIDLVVSNILMALGMIMIAPTTISLPFKLLLFCMVDGWTHLMDGLIMTYHL